MKITRPTRTELEKFLNKDVKIKLFDGDILIGKLIKAEKIKRYTIENSRISFRVSHIETLEQFSKLNEMLVKNGLNNPQAQLK